MSRSRSAKRGWLIVAFLAAGAALGYWWFADCEICEAQLSQNLPLSGSIGLVCSIVVSPAPAAANLPGLASTTPTSVEVATLAQTCNDAAGFKLYLSSAHCLDTPAGGKLELTTTDYVAYALEFQNPASVTGLLGGGCTGDTYTLARSVTTIDTGDTSHIFAHYTGSTSLPTGIYSDTVTITMTTN